MLTRNIILEIYPGPMIIGMNYVIWIFMTKRKWIRTSGTYLVSIPPGPLKPITGTSELEAVVKVVFHFDEGFDWRLPGPDDQIFHPTGDGYIGMLLEHLRVGFLPRCPIF